MKAQRTLLVTMALLAVLSGTLCASGRVADTAADDAAGAPTLTKLRQTAARVAELGDDVDWMGPTAPPWVTSRERFDPPPSWTVYVIPGVPGYEWRHGCTPTAIGMIMGYYDGQGHGNLMPGDASTQTEAINQAIASQRSELNPANYEDYCLPMDSHGGTILPDLSEDPPGDEHTNDCIADFIGTSWSVRDMAYGWTRTSYLEDAVPEYIESRYPDYDAFAEFVHIQFGTLSWEFFKAEMDAGRPMQMSVDTDGDGSSDHSVATIGYAQNAAGDSMYYGCLDTWGPASDVRWCEFAQMEEGQGFGVRRATLITLDRSLIVDAGGGEEYTTIQDAIDAAPDGRMIKVMPGTYTGIGNIDIDPGDKSLHIMAMNTRGDVIIDCENAGHAFYFNSSQDTTTVIEGFTIRNGLATYGGAVECFWTCSPKLVDLTIEYCQATTDGGAIACRANSNPIIRNCSIYQCASAGRGGGMFCGASSPIVSETTIAECSSGGEGGGMYCFSTSSPVVTNTVIANSIAGAGIAVDGTATPTVDHCCVFGNAGGDAVPAGGDNLFDDPLFCPSALTLYDDSPCLPANNAWGEQIGTYGAGGCGTPVNGIFYAVATGANEVTLRWDLDFIDGIDGLIIKRALNEDGPYEPVTRDPLAFITPGVHVDETVWPETTFWYRLNALMWDGTEDICGQGEVTVSTAGTLAVHFARPTPTPFTESTTLAFEIPRGAERTRITVFDAAGRCVRTLVDEEVGGGRWNVVWNGRDDTGAKVAAGVYFVRFECDEVRRGRKLVLVR